MPEANRSIFVRDMIETDSPIIAEAFAAQGWDKPRVQYQGYYSEAGLGQRAVLIGECDGRFAGYVTIVWESGYGSFLEQGIPELVDFNVLIKFQRQGVGTALLEEAERRGAARSSVVGLGVGLTADYGAAQILYIKRGYVPDGRGISQRGAHLRYGEQLVVDDDLVLYLVKSVYKNPKGL